MPSWKGHGMMRQHACTFSFDSIVVLLCATEEAYSCANRRHTLCRFSHAVVSATAAISVHAQPICKDHLESLRSHVLFFAPASPWANSVADHLEAKA